MHCEMEGRVVPFDGLEELSDFDCRIQLLPDFTFQCLLRGLSGFNLAARELPPVLEFPIAALGGEYSVAPPYYGCRHFYTFHCIMLFLKAGNCPAHSFLLLNLIPEVSEDKLQSRVPGHVVRVRAGLSLRHIPAKPGEQSGPELRHVPVLVPEIHRDGGEKMRAVPAQETFINQFRAVHHSV